MRFPRLLVLILALAACVPGRHPGTNGFTNALAPNFGSVTVAQPPTFFGDHPDAPFHWWNQVAGRALFVRSDINPQITFQAGGPYITPPEFGSRRVVTYVDWSRNPDQSLNHCTVFYDPSWVAPITDRALTTRVLAHEIGHCLDLEGHQGCEFQGVMSACEFWPRGIANLSLDRHDTVQLRAAGYIS